MREYQLSQQQKRIRKRRLAPRRTRHHKLLVFRRTSRRMSRLVSLVALLMLALGLYDQYTEFLGDHWIVLWASFFMIMSIWVYYVILMRRASVQVNAKYLRFQGPVIGLNISYGRIHSITSGKMEQHYDFDSLNKSERVTLKPFFGNTCLFVELTSYPRIFRWRKLWFPRFLFGTTRHGLICHVDDWMALSSDIETARSHRRTQMDQHRYQREHTLVGHILAEEM